jgi:hypothetical protein
MEAAYLPLPREMGQSGDSSVSVKQAAVCPWRAY